MFTLAQIQEAFKKVKSGADFPQFVQDLKSIGVWYYDNYVADGRTLYASEEALTIDGGAKYPSIAINDSASVDKLKIALAIHQQGKTDYPTFCEQAADAGVEKWRTHMIEMTVNYYDREDNLMLSEAIPQPI